MGADSNLDYSGASLPSFSPRPPSLSHHSPTLLTSTRKEMESQAQLSQQPRSQTPSLQNFNIPRRHGTWAPAYVSTEQHLHGVEGAPVARTYRWRPTALETQEKNSTETESRSSPAIVHACPVPGWSIPGKIWMPTNQIRAISAGAHVSRELRTRALQTSQGI